MLYEFINSHKETVPFIFFGTLAVFAGIHLLLDRQVDKSIPYKCPKPISYFRTGLIILISIISFFFLAVEPLLTGLLVTSGSAIITGLASFVEGLYIGVNMPETKRHRGLYVGATFSLVFGFAVLLIGGSWFEV